MVLTEIAAARYRAPKSAKRCAALASRFLTTSLLLSWRHSTKTSVRLQLQCDVWVLPSCQEASLFPLAILQEERSRLTSSSAFSPKSPPSQTSSGGAHICVGSGCDFRSHNPLPPLPVFPFLLSYDPAGRGSATLDFSSFLQIVYSTRS